MLKEKNGSGRIIMTGVRWAESVRRSRRGQFEAYAQLAFEDDESEQRALELINRLNIDLQNALIEEEQLLSDKDAEIDRLKKAIGQIKLILGSTPELNMCNYEHDEVHMLNNGMTAIHFIIEEAEAAKNTEGLQSTELRNSAGLTIRGFGRTVLRGLRDE